MHKNWILLTLLSLPLKPRIGSARACIVIGILYNVDRFQLHQGEEQTHWDEKSKEKVGGGGNETINFNKIKMKTYGAHIRPNVKNKI